MTMYSNNLDPNGIKELSAGSRSDSDDYPGKMREKIRPR